MPVFDATLASVRAVAMALEAISAVCDTQGVKRARGGGPRARPQATVRMGVGTFGMGISVTHSDNALHAGCLLGPDLFARFVFREDEAAADVCAREIPADGSDTPPPAGDGARSRSHSVEFATPLRPLISALRLADEAGRAALRLIYPTADGALKATVADGDRHSAVEIRPHAVPPTRGLLLDAAFAASPRVAEAEFPAAALRDAVADIARIGGTTLELCFVPDGVVMRGAATVASTTVEFRAGAPHAALAQYAPPADGGVVSRVYLLSHWDIAVREAAGAVRSVVSVNAVGCAQVVHTVEDVTVVFTFAPCAFPDGQ